MYVFFFFFFNDTATTEIYTLSLHDALPIYVQGQASRGHRPEFCNEKHGVDLSLLSALLLFHRSEEHTSELQSLAYLVCRLLLEKKKKTKLPVMRLQNKRTTGGEVNAHAMCE